MQNTLYNKFVWMYSVIHTMNGTNYKYSLCRFTMYNLNNSHIRELYNLNNYLYCRYYPTNKNNGRFYPLSRWDYIIIMLLFINLPCWLYPCYYRINFKLMWIFQSLPFSFLLLSTPRIYSKVWAVRIWLLCHLPASVSRVKAYSFILYKDY